MTLKTIFIGIAFSLVLQSCYLSSEDLEDCYRDRDLCTPRRALPGQSCHWTVECSGKSVCVSYEEEEGKYSYETDTQMRMQEKPCLNEEESGCGVMDGVCRPLCVVDEDCEDGFYCYLNGLYPESSIPDFSYYAGFCAPEANRDELLEFCTSDFQCGSEDYPNHDMACMARFTHGPDFLEYVPNPEHRRRIYESRTDFSPTNNVSTECVFMCQYDSDCIGPMNSSEALCTYDAGIDGAYLQYSGFCSAYPEYFVDPEQSLRLHRRAYSEPKSCGLATDAPCNEGEACFELSEDQREVYGMKGMCREFIPCDHEFECSHDLNGGSGAFKCASSAMFRPLVYIDQHRPYEGGPVEAQSEKYCQSGWEQKVIPTGTCGHVSVRGDEVMGCHPEERCLQTDEKQVGFCYNLPACDDNCERCVDVYNRYGDKVMSQTCADGVDWLPEEVQGLYEFFPRR